ncbi:DUF4347 domain-containing protein, partial [Pseudanabaena sp. PCC 6802]|uniref:DUF4347 domain-containing protein n=1 Tax=Pseudanabaena sp. PCC 6802 TaxID=118173 RepID=UPI000475ED2C
MSTDPQDFSASLGSLDSQTGQTPPFSVIPSIQDLDKKDNSASSLLPDLLPDTQDLSEPSASRFDAFGNTSLTFTGNDDCSAGKDDRLVGTVPKSIGANPVSVEQKDKRIAIIDIGISGYSSILASIDPKAEIFFVDPTRNGVAQISELLSDRTDISGIDIISHGSAGQLQLGNFTLSGDNIDQYSQQLQSWSSALTSDADIRFWGCNVAEGAIGETFISQISTLTGADVAASDDLTGNSNLGGDWDLESAIGNINSISAIDAEKVQSYSGTLAKVLNADFMDFNLFGGMLDSAAMTIFYDNIYTGSDADGMSTTVDLLISYTSNGAMFDNDTLFDNDSINPSRFQPVIQSTLPGGGYFDFNFQFFEDGTAFTSMAPVSLANFSATGVDIDGYSFPAAGMEYYEIGGFANYQVGTMTGLMVDPSTLSDGVMFTGVAGELPGISFEEMASFVVNYTTFVSSFNVRLGVTSKTAEDVENRQFSLAIGTPLTITIPAIMLGTILPSPIDDPVIANDDTAATSQDTPVNISFPSILSNDSFPDGFGNLTFIQPANGTIAQLNGSDGMPGTIDDILVYTPNPGFSGTDTFVYTLTDADIANMGIAPPESDTATVTITVNSPNSPPDAVNDSTTTTIGTPVSIGVLSNDTDPNNDPLSIVAGSISAPGNGMVVIDPGATTSPTDDVVVYTPNSGFTGTDSFTYT